MNWRKRSHFWIPFLFAFFLGKQRLLLYLIDVIIELYPSISKLLLLFWFSDIFLLLFTLRMLWKGLITTVFVIVLWLSCHLDRELHLLFFLNCLFGYRFRLCYFFLFFAWWCKLSKLRKERWIKVLKLWNESKSTRGIWVRQLMIDTLLGVIWQEIC